MPRKANVDLEVTDIRQMVVGEDPAAGAVITLQLVDDQIIDLHVPHVALAKLEAFMAQAALAQAKHQPVH